MVDQLEVPLPLPCLQIDRDQTLSEQVVAWPMAAVEVGRRRLDGQIHEAELLVDGHLVPDAHVAVPRPGSCRGAAAPRAPSGSPCTQSSSPVAASSATAARRVPAVV